MNNNQKIKFHYDSESISKYEILSIYNEANTQNLINYRRSFVRENVLKEIVFPKGRVQFEYDTQSREDLSGSKALKNIKVLDAAQKLVQEHRLNYEFTKSSSAQDMTGFLKVDSSANKRMFLKNIEKLVTKPDRFLTDFEFEYNPIVLPNIHSSSEDLWGYFNNAPNRDEYFSLSNNRSANRVYSQASLLKKIKLRTGGEIRFEYEANEFKLPNYFKDLYITGLENSTVSASNEIDAYNNLGLLKNKNLYNGSYFSKPFIIEKSQNYNFSNPKVYVTTLFSMIQQCPNEVSCKYRAYIVDSNGVIISDIKKGNGALYLLPGSYEVKVVPRGRINLNEFIEDEEFMIALKWKKEQKPIEAKKLDMLGPGNRIAEISYWDEYGLMQELTRYEYKNPDGSTTGRMFSIPGYLTILKENGQKGSVLKLRGAYPHLHTAEDLSPNTSFNTDQYGYSEITEYNDMYKISKKYTVFEDPGYHFVFPFHVAIDLSWTRGKLLEVNKYKNKEGTWKLEQTIKNKYQFYNEVSHPFLWDTGNDMGAYNRGIGYDHLVDLSDEDSSLVSTSPSYSITNKKIIFPLYKLDRFMDLDNYTDGRGADTIPRHNFYRKSYFVGGVMNLTETVIANYEGSNKVISKEFFKYSSAKHNQLTEYTNTMPDDNVLKHTFKYASDLPDIIAKEMAKQNILQPFLHSKIFNNQQLIEITDNNFKDIGNNVFKLHSVSSQKGQSDLRQEKFKINYNLKGKEIEIIEEEQKKTVFLWGHNGEYLIAQIGNASKEEVASALGITVANLGTIDETKFAQINNLRTHAALKNAMITTYEHKPLVGVTKITDTKGSSTYYEYDDANRLQYIKDDKGNVLQQYEYNYKNN